jgi:hypothetical protein
LYGALVLSPPLQKRRRHKNLWLQPQRTITSWKYVATAAKNDYVIKICGYSGKERLRHGNLWLQPLERRPVLLEQKLGAQRMQTSICGEENDTRQVQVEWHPGRHWASHDDVISAERDVMIADHFYGESYKAY